jgi:hypothetical protein
MVMDQLKKQNPQTKNNQRIRDPSRNNTLQDPLENQDSPKKQQKQMP